MVFVIEGRATEINQPNVGALHTPNFTILKNKFSDESSLVIKAVAPTHLSSIKCRRKVRVGEKNVLWLEVRVRQFVVVKKLHSKTKLIANMPYVLHRVSFVVVVFQEVKDAESQNFKRDACVTVVVKPIEDLHT